MNPVTQSDDLEIIFSRFGKVETCEVIRDWKTGDSLQYAFVEFETEDACLTAYSRMDGVLIDERRIKVDFSNSVAKLWNSHNRKKLQEKAQEIIEQERSRDQTRQKFSMIPTERRRSPPRDNKSSRSRGDDYHRRDSRRRSRSRSRERYHSDRHHRYRDDGRNRHPRSERDRRDKDRQHSHRR